MYGLGDIDEKLFLKLQQMQVESKFFIEAGANDGLCQSNTAFLEFHCGWNGILVEPNIVNAKRTKENRPNSEVFHGALVSKNYPHEMISGTFTDTALSRWNGLCSGVTEFHINENPEWVCEVPALKLSDILSQCNAPSDIGVFSLDVEGHELEVLDGMDLEKWRPHVILMEIGEFQNSVVFEKHVNFMKQRGYFLESELTEHDFIFVDERRGNK